VDEERDVFRHVVVAVFEREQEMGGEATVETDLAYTPQRWAQVPIPVRKVGVRGPPEVNDGFSEGQKSVLVLTDTDRTNQCSIERAIRVWGSRDGS